MPIYTFITLKEAVKVLNGEEAPVAMLTEKEKQLLEEIRLKKDELIDKFDIEW